MSKTKKIVSLNKYYLLRLEKRQKNKCIIHKKMAFILDKWNVNFLNDCNRSLKNIK